MLSRVQQLWRSPLVSARVRTFLRPLARQMRNTLTAMRARGAEPLGPGPITVSGFLGETLGIGRAGRLTADALEAAGFEVLRHDVRPALERGRFHAETLPGGYEGVWILQANPE